MEDWKDLINAIDDYDEKQAKPKFKPASEELPSVVDRYSEFAEVDEAIVKEAAATFKEFPPDEEMVNLLEAKDQRNPTSQAPKL